MQVPQSHLLYFTLLPIEILIHWASNEIMSVSNFNPAMDPPRSEDYIDIAGKAIGPILDYEKFKALDFSIKDGRVSCRDALITLGKVYHHGLDSAERVNMPVIERDHHLSQSSLFRICTLLVVVRIGLTRLIGLRQDMTFSTAQDSMEV
jgi:hypothetical protein